MPWAACRLASELGCCAGRGRVLCLLGWWGAGLRLEGGAEGCMHCPEVLGMLLGPLLGMLANLLLDELG